MNARFEPPPQDLQHATIFGVARIERELSRLLGLSVGEGQHDHGSADVGHQAHEHVELADVRLHQARRELDRLVDAHRDLRSTRERIGHHTAARARR